MFKGGTVAKRLYRFLPFLLLATTLAGLAQGASHPFFPPANSPTGANYVSDEFLVELKPGFSRADRARVGSALGAAQALRARPDILRVKMTHGLSVEEAIRKIKQDPAVAVAEPNYLTHASQVCSVPTSITDPYFNSAPGPVTLCAGQTGTGNMNWPFLLINAPAAWATLGAVLACPAANPLTVAVLDSGIASDDTTTNQPDLPAEVTAIPDLYRLMVRDAEEAGARNQRAGRLAEAGALAAVPA